MFEDVRDALVGSGLEPSLLTLEITETMLMRDATRSAQQLRGLKHLGLRVAIDDFGTGYCSLAYLQQLPVDALKIDRVLHQRHRQQPGGGCAHPHLRAAGQDLWHRDPRGGHRGAEPAAVPAGGGCDSGQGYLFARPLSPEALEELITGPAEAALHFSGPAPGSVVPTR